MGVLSGIMFLLSALLLHLRRPFGFPDPTVTLAEHAIIGIRLHLCFRGNP